MTKKKKTLDKSCFDEMIRVKKCDWNGLRENRERTENGMYGQLCRSFTEGSREIGKKRQIFSFMIFFYFLESKNLYGGVEKRILAGVDRRGRKLVNRLCMDHLWLSFSTSALLVF